jgi:hypothetical protein
MMRKALIVALALPLGTAELGCADREQLRASQMAEQASASAEDDAACRPKGAPGSPEYDECRKGLAAARAQKAAIQYQKARDFDRVLGAGTSGSADMY